MIYWCNTQYPIGYINIFIVRTFIVARRKVFQYWCNSPGTMVRKLPAYMAEILLGKGVK
jgi:hypothetical protein